MRNIILLALLLTACGPEREVVQVFRGEQGVSGANGVDGSDGQDGVSCTLTSLESGVVIRCGDDEQLIEVPQSSGSSLSVYYSAASCTQVGDLFIKKTGNNIGVYSSEECHSSDKEIELNVGEAFWFSSRILGVAESGGVRTLEMSK